METSTPALSPRKRKSYAALEKSFISLEENDLAIESEIKDRRLDLINKSTEVRKSSAPLLDLQHYNDCIKLSAENKINSKNAFSLLLIDLMGMLTKKKDSEINQNFQLASCTLDASVKIYGYRVDAVHTDIIKMAVGFCGQEKQKNDDKNDENDDGEENDVKTKAKKKKKKKLTVVKPETLNSKNDSDILLDVVPRQNLFSQITDGSQILVKIPKFDDFCQIMIDPEFPMWPYDGNEDLVPKSIENRQICSTDVAQELKNLNVNENDVICKKYNYFEFGKNYEDENSEENDLDVSQTGNDYEFDINASVQEVNESDEDNEEVLKTGAKINLPLGGYESGEEIEVRDHYEVKHHNSAKITDMKKRISRQTLEYSIFDENVFKSWAGPTYWKVKPVLSKNQSDANKENEDGSRQVAAKRTRKGKTIPLVNLFDVSDDLLKNYLSSNTKTTLATATMNNWDPHNTIMPKDCQYKSKNLFALFLMPSMIVEPKRDEDSYNDDSKLQADSNNIENSNYDDDMIDDFNDSSHTNNGNLISNDCSDKLETVDKTVLDIQQWDTDNMVPLPNKVEKIFVPSFKRTKHVDIKHLKRLIWNILTASDNKHESENKMNSSITFNNLLTSYASRRSTSHITNLSAPMVFNALLHLTNEKCLILKQDKEKRKIDFEIGQ